MDTVTCKRVTCKRVMGHVESLSRNRGTHFSLWSQSTLFVKAETLFFTDLGASGFSALCPDMASQQKKPYTKISQSASQLKILEQKRPALSELNACCRRHAVIGPCERVQVPIWESH